MVTSIVIKSERRVVKHDVGYTGRASHWKPAARLYTWIQGYGTESIAALPWREHDHRSKHRLLRRPCIGAREDSRAGRKAGCPALWQLEELEQ